MEVEKGAVAGVGGAGSLGGAVNFRTVTADDIIKPDRDRGVELNAETGTNAYYFNGSLIGAARFSEDFSVLGGISRKRVGDYDFGQNGKSPLLDLAVTTAVDDSFLFSRLETFGTLLKVEGSPSDDFTFDLSWLRNDSEAIQGGLVFGDLRDDPQNYLNNTVSSSFEWDPDSELIDLKGRLWYNRVVNDELRDYTPRLPITYAMTSFGGSLDNRAVRNGAGRPLAELRRRGLFRRRQDDHAASRRRPRLRRGLRLQGIEPGRPPVDDERVPQRHPGA